MAISCHTIEYYFHFHFFNDYQLICIYLKTYRNFTPKLLPGKGRLNSDKTVELVRFFILPDMNSRLIHETVLKAKIYRCTSRDATFCILGYFKVVEVLFHKSQIDK